VGLNLLAEDLDEGLGILREVLTAPRFQEDKIALRKQQILQAMQQRNDESSAIEERERGFLAFGENFWDNHYSTAASLNSLTRAHLEKFHQQWFILVVGKKDQILLGHLDHPVKLTQLAGDRLTDLPLRDPLTMKPLSASASTKPSSQ
jgi:hypothetical protein